LPAMLPSSTTWRAARMNTVILIGNLTTDVELREFGPEKQLAKFGLAVDRGGKDSETDFFRISAWDRQAQLCADYLAKGRKIALEGRLRYSTWEEEGKKRSAVEVVAYRLEFLSAPTGSGAEVVPFEAAVA
jgi:single-strand DNA-binding protein